MSDLHLAILMVIAHAAGEKKILVPESEVRRILEPIHEDENR